jgi:hypothetical protein
MNHDGLQAENAALRKRVEELERKLYPAPPPPKEPDDPNRYILVPREIHERDDGWARVQQLFASWAIQYARDRHPDFHWHYAYGWDDIPDHGEYTTARLAHDAKRADGPVGLYKIDDRRRALDAISAERGRLRECEDGLIKSRAPRRSLAEHRVWAHRWKILRKASDELDRPFSIACAPLTDYYGVTRAAAHIVDSAVAAAQSDISTEEVPGYMPGGWWECQDCGYPYPDHEAQEGGDAYTCCPCRVASPASERVHAETVGQMRAEGQEGIAEELERAWRAAVDRAAAPSLPWERGGNEHYPRGQLLARRCGSNALR